MQDQYDGTQMPMELAGDLTGTRDLGTATFNIGSLTASRFHDDYAHHCGSVVIIKNFDGAASARCWCGKTLDFILAGRKIHVIERQ